MIKPHLWGNAGPAAIEFIYWSCRLNVIITSYEQLLFLLEEKNMEKRKTRKKNPVYKKLDHFKMEKWKTRKELPVYKKLDHFKFDSKKLLEAYHEFTDNKVWDGLGSEYASLCETYSHLPQQFFTKEELESVDCVCDLDWEKASYQQFSLVKFDENYSLDKRVEKSNTKWDTKIAKNKPYADERFFRSRVSGLPSYFNEVLDAFDGKAHRARFAKLAPKSRVKPHIDYNTEYGIRVHIPIITNEKCFNGGKDPATDKEVITHFDADGSTYFINPGVLHWAVNDGEEERVHLIISVDSQEILNG